MSNPYLITGLALLSISGGLTSGFMFRKILDAHDGRLPDDVHVTFANTGKERKETLDFLRAMQDHWGQRITMLEWRPKVRGAPVDTRFEIVNDNSMDREGVWFAELIRRKQYLPNAVMRYCTIEMKIRVMRDYMVSLGYKRWHNAVGLRADEMHRVFKAIERNEQGKERFRTIMPMADAGHRLEDVRAFWGEHPFTLNLRPHEGNCDLCFLKGRDKRAAIMRADPALADWWIKMEDSAKCSKPDGARFRANESYRTLLNATLNSPLLPGLEDEEEFDAECGLHCAGE